MCSGVESLSMTLPIFHESFLLTSGFFPGNEEISVPPPSGFLIGIYIFYESWSTETFRKKKSKKRAVCHTCMSLSLDRTQNRGLLVKILRVRGLSAHGRMYWVIGAWIEGREVGTCDVMAASQSRASLSRRFRRHLLASLS